MQKGAECKARTQHASFCHLPGGDAMRSAARKSCPAMVNGDEWDIMGRMRASRSSLRKRAASRSMRWEAESTSGSHLLEEFYWRRYTIAITLTPEHFRFACHGRVKA